MSEYVVVQDAEALEQAKGLARGSYQRAILEGRARLSGGDLKGRAKDYAPRYARSRDSLLTRMTEAGVPWREMKGEHGKRVLVIGEG